MGISTAQILLLGHCLCDIMHVYYTPTAFSAGHTSVSRIFIGFFRGVLSFRDLLQLAPWPSRFDSRCHTLTLQPRALRGSQQQQDESFGDKFVTAKRSGRAGDRHVSCRERKDIEPSQTSQDWSFVDICCLLCFFCEGQLHWSNVIYLTKSHLLCCASYEYVYQVHENPEIQFQNLLCHNWTFVRGSWKIYDTNPSNALKIKENPSKFSILGGGWATQLEEYARQTGPFLQVGVKLNKCLKPPPSIDLCVIYCSLKINMESKNGGLETNDFPFQKRVIFSFHLWFPGGL